MSPSNVVASTTESHIQISAQSRDIESAPLELTFLPPMYIDTKEIIFVATQGTVPSVTFEVYGVPSVLQHLTVSTLIRIL